MIRKTWYEDKRAKQLPSVPDIYAHRVTNRNSYKKRLDPQEKFDNYGYRLVPARIPTNLIKPQKVTKIWKKFAGDINYEGLYKNIKTTSEDIDVK